MMIRRSRIDCFVEVTSRLVEVLNQVMRVDGEIELNPREENDVVRRDTIPT